jgi:hypothetical protein
MPQQVPASRPLYPAVRYRPTPGYPNYSTQNRGVLPGTPGWYTASTPLTGWVDDAVYFNGDPADATAAGGSSTFTGSATFTTLAGSATAAGGTSTFAVDATFTTLAGSATAAGGDTTFAGDIPTPPDVGHGPGRWKVIKRPATQLPQPVIDAEFASIVGALVASGGVTWFEATSTPTVDVHNANAHRILALIDQL